MPPARGFAVLTCMDARLGPAQFAGLAEGNAHVLRNAGGRASDNAIRSLVISYKQLGTRERFVVRHTDWGMETFDDATMAGLLESSLEPASLNEAGWNEAGWQDKVRDPGTVEGHYVNWLTIADRERAVVDNVVRIRASAMVPGDIPIHGYISDCATGRLNDVAEVTRAITPDTEYAQRHIARRSAIFFDPYAQGDSVNDLIARSPICA